LNSILYYDNIRISLKGGIMKVDVLTKSHGIKVIKPHGKIVSGPKVMKLKETINKLIEKGDKELILDLDRVPFMDSTGLGVLIAAYTSLQKEDGKLKLVHVDKRIKDLLTITKLLSLFDCYDSEADAVKNILHG